MNTLWPELDMAHNVKTRDRPGSGLSTFFAGFLCIAGFSGLPALAGYTKSGSGASLHFKEKYQIQTDETKQVTFDIFKIM